MIPGEVFTIETANAVNPRTVFLSSDSYGHEFDADGIFNEFRETSRIVELADGTYRVTLRIEL